MIIFHPLSFHLASIVVLVCGDVASFERCPIIEVTIHLSLTMPLPEELINVRSSVGQIRCR